MHEMNDVTIARSREAGTAKRAEWTSQLSVSSGKQRQQVCCAAVYYYNRTLLLRNGMASTNSWLFPIYFIRKYFSSDNYLCVAVSIVRGIRSTCSWFRSANLITFERMPAVNRFVSCWILFYDTDRAGNLYFCAPFRVETKKSTLLQVQARTGVFYGYYRR
jgi:hypothetical protein